MNLVVLAVLIPYLANYILFYNRKSRWAISKLRWFVVASIFLIALVLLLLPDDLVLGVPEFVFWGFMSPMIFSLIDFGFKILSFRIHNRDLYLWARGSSEINDRKFSGGKHVRFSDRLFSMIMVIFIIFMPFIMIWLSKL